MKTQLLRYLQGGVVEDEIRRIAREEIEKAKAPKPAKKEK